MGDALENLGKEGTDLGSLYGEIISSETADYYIDLVKRKVIPRLLMDNDELFPIDPEKDLQKILASFNVTMSLEGQYSFLYRE